MSYATGITTVAVTVIAIVASSGPASTISQYFEIDGHLGVIAKYTYDTWPDVLKLPVILQVQDPVEVCNEAMFGILLWG